MSQPGPDNGSNYPDVWISVPDIFEIFPVIFLGNFARSRCGTAAFGQEIASKTAEISKFPVNYPVSRESSMETGSYLTAHTTIAINDLVDLLTPKFGAVYTTVYSFVLASSFSTAASAS